MLISFSTLESISNNSHARWAPLRRRSFNRVGRQPALRLHSSALVLHCANQARASPKTVRGSGSQLSHSCFPSPTATHSACLTFLIYRPLFRERSERLVTPSLITGLTDRSRLGVSASTFRMLTGIFACEGGYTGLRQPPLGSHESYLVAEARCLSPRRQSYAGWCDAHLAASPPWQPRASGLPGGGSGSLTAHPFA